VAPALRRPGRRPGAVGEELGEAYDDLVEEAPDWFSTHGPVARKALADAVQRLRGVLSRPA
jgi:hypothetical protein